MRLLIVLLLVGFVAADFSDSFSRNIMMPLSGAAYSDTPQLCLDQKLNGAKVSLQVTLNCDYFHDKCSGFTFIDKSKRIIGLAFRGSTNTAQLVVELQQTGFEKKVDFKDGGKVSKYFNDAFVDLWDGGLGDDLKQLIDEHRGYDLWITGHSLGGAIASLASAHIVSLDWISGDKITQYTFGQPRTGDQTYANVHDNLIKNAYRVVHHRDMVAHVPPEFMKYVHHKSEVFYNNDMNIGDAYTVCTAQEDKQCSDQLVFETSINDHTHYYGVEVADFGRAGCQ